MCPLSVVLMLVLVLLVVLLVLVLLVLLLLALAGTAAAGTAAGTGCCWHWVLLALGGTVDVAGTGWCCC